MYMLGKRSMMRAPSHCMLFYVQSCCQLIKLTLSGKLAPIHYHCLKCFSGTFILYIYCSPKNDIHRGGRYIHWHTHFCIVSGHYQTLAYISSSHCYVFILHCTTVFFPFDSGSLWPFPFLTLFQLMSNLKPLVLRQLLPELQRWSSVHCQGEDDLLYATRTTSLEELHLSTAADSKFMASFTFI